MDTRRLILVLASGLVALAACSDKPATQQSATLQLSPCRVAHVDTEVKCGTLEVFENRATGQGRKIAINIVVLPAIARNKEPDPVFLFAGGPGQAAGELAREAQAIVGGLNNKRDVVLIDQRGTGKSNGLACMSPDMTSPEMNDPVRRDAENRKSITSCRDKLVKKADLSQYTTTIAMADIDDVREALGYQSINLWGGSYGTRSAMEYLRRFENRVRSVVLDGVAPPSLMLPESFSRDATAVLEKMSVACAKEAQCNKQHADVMAMFGDLLASHAKTPRKVVLADPVTGIKRDVIVDRETLLTAVFPALYVPEMVAMLPAALASAKRGDYSSMMALSGIFSNFTEEKMARGMQLSVLCTEDVPRIKQREAGLQPQPFGRIFIEEFAKACEIWPKGTTPKDFDQPVKSAKPILIFSGGLDPVTPPANGEEVKKTLSNALHVIAPNIGHGVSHHGCAPKMIKKFVENASVVDLDAKCLERIPRPLFFSPLREKAKTDVAESPLPEGKK